MGQINSKSLPTTYAEEKTPRQEQQDVEDTKVQDVRDTKVQGRQDTKGFVLEDLTLIPLDEMLNEMTIQEGKSKAGTSMGNDCSKCDICSISFSGKDNYKEHMAGKKHRRAVYKLKMKNLEKGEFGPDLFTEDIEKRPDGYFCVLCNCALLDERSSISHIVGRRHRKHLARRESGNENHDDSGKDFVAGQNCAARSGISSPTSKDKRHLTGSDTIAVAEKESGIANDSSPAHNLSCSICDCIMMSPSNYEDHQKGSRHMKMLRTLEMNEVIASLGFEANENSSSKGEENTAANGTVSLPSAANSHEAEEVYGCDVCGVIMTDALNLKQHLKGARHRKALNRLEALKRIQNLETKDPVITKYTCDICDCTMLDKANFDDHLAGKRHRAELRRQMLKEELSRSNENNVAVDKLFCEICDCEMSDVVALKQHQVGARHRAEVRRQQLKEELSKSDEITVVVDKPYCEICDCEMSDLVSFKQHQKGARHKRALKRQNSPSPSSSSEDVNDDARGLKCDICECEMPDVLSAEQHFKGSRHRKALVRSQEDNGDILNHVESIAENMLKCEICDCEMVGISTVKEHLAGARHRRALANRDAKIELASARERSEALNQGKQAGDTSCVVEPVKVTA